MLDTELGYYRISETVRDQIYLVLAMVMKLNNDSRFMGQYEAEKSILWNEIFPQSREISYHEYTRDFKESHLAGMMKDCVEKLSVVCPIHEGQESVYIAYGKELEKKWLGCPYNMELLMEQFWLMHFDLAA